MKALAIEQEQKIQLGIMDYLHNICLKEGLTYYLGFGSLIGAIREHGFIGWDDDIDVLMKRADVEKLKKVIIKYPDPAYFLQTIETDPDMLYPGIVRICVNNTLKYSDEHYQNADFHKGIYLDIFPLDFAHETVEEDVAAIEKSRQILYFIRTKFKRVNEIRSIKGFVAFCLAKILPKNRLVKGYINTTQKYPKNNARLIAYPSSYKALKIIFPAEWFAETINVDFCDRKYWGPACYDQILTQLYGDYMTPKQTKDYFHEAYIIDERKDFPKLS